MGNNGGRIGGGRLWRRSAIARAVWGIGGDFFLGGVLGYLGVEGLGEHFGGGAFWKYVRIRLHAFAMGWEYAELACGSVVNEGASTHYWRFGVDVVVINLERCTGFRHELRQAVVLLDE